METNLQIWENFKKVFDIGFDDKHRLVILLKYGLNGEKPKTLEEVGKILQISRQRVQQILSKCKKKLKHSTKQRFWKPITDEIYSGFRDERDLIIGSDELKKLLSDDINKESLLQELKALSLILDLDKRFSPVWGTGKKRVGWVTQGEGENLETPLYSPTVETVQDNVTKPQDVLDNDFFTLHTLPKTAIGVYEDIKQLKKVDIKQLVSNFRLSKKYIFNIISDLKMLKILRKSDHDNHDLIPVDGNYNSVIISRLKDNPAIKELLVSLRERKEVPIKDFSSMMAPYFRDRKINERTYIIYARTLSIWLDFFRLSKHYGISIYSPDMNFDALPKRIIGAKKSNYPFLMNTYNEVLRLMKFAANIGPFSKQQISKLFKKSPKTIERILIDGYRLEFFERNQKRTISLSRLGQEFLATSIPLRQYILKNQLRNYPFVEDFLERLSSGKSSDPDIATKSLLEEKELARKENTITEITRNTLSWCIVAGLLKRKVKIRKISYFELVGNDK